MRWSMDSASRLTPYQVAVVVEVAGRPDSLRPNGHGARNRRVIRLALLFLLATAATVTFARPSTLSMSCRQAQTLLASKGAVVMTTGANTYNRFVANERYCMTAEWAYPATARTKDLPSCRLGYTCTTEPPFGGEGRAGGFGSRW
jgi:hypothetical protein